VAGKEFEGPFGAFDMMVLQGTCNAMPAAVSTRIQEDPR